MRLNKSIVSGFAAALLASFAAGPAAAQTSAGVAQASAILDISKIGIDNFGRINANYYRGAQPKGGDYTDLKALGIKTLIDLTGDDVDRAEEGMAGRAGLAYFHIAMTTHDAPTATKLAEFLNIVNDPANQPVYVHCVGGRHRTGVMTAVYRMTQDGWSPDRAFGEMKQYKFGADFLHPEFKEFVYGYRADAARAAAAPAGAVKADR